jgi:hypothetical protein
MTRSPRHQATYVLSILFAAAPFGFGLLRAVTRHDFGGLGMAVASFLGATAIAAVGKGRTPKPSVSATSMLILIVATGLAALAAYAFGSRASPGIWMVAFVVGLCWATSYAVRNSAR